MNQWYCAQKGRLDALDARLLLQHVLGFSRAELLTRERALSPDERARLDTLAARRIAGEPLAYLTGEAGFFGRTFAVSPAVLVPRPETEVLVSLALEKLKEMASTDLAGGVERSATHADARSEKACRVLSNSRPRGLRAARSTHPTPHVPLRLLDLGTGSGAIAITLALETAAEVTACDLSAAALT
ncbi:MAG: hypothetical protein LBL69_04580, partial [Zoogloeaceae bacterium]|nr:hypothetical protein [Zoogloeaceae bacterium]